MQNTYTIHKISTESNDAFFTRVANEIQIMAVKIINVHVETINTPAYVTITYQDLPRKETR